MKYELSHCMGALVFLLNKPEHVISIFPLLACTKASKIITYILFIISSKTA